VGRIVSLINLIRREVSCVDIRGELRLEWCTNSAQGLEFNATEEFVVLNFIGRDTTKAIFSVADKAKEEDQSG